jgi:hypothetical protein
MTSEQLSMRKNIYELDRRVMDLLAIEAEVYRVLDHPISYCVDYLECIHSIYKLSNKLYKLYDTYETQYHENLSLMTIPTSARLNSWRIYQQQLKNPCIEQVQNLRN